jgi:hypothetical protein
MTLQIVVERFIATIETLDNIKFFKMTDGYCQVSMPTISPEVERRNGNPSVLLFC